ncbi:MAG: GAF domain-containing sensor histidine kinase [Gemmatimonadaceae bacterium]
MPTISSLSELHAALFQALITAGLCTLTGALYARYRRRYLLWWTVAWSLYFARIGVISVFLVAGDPRLLFIHQVLTGWTALALLWSALLFSQEREWRRWYAAVALFPLVWSYIAIYELNNFFIAAWPAVLFLSGATFWTGWVFLRHHRRVGSPGARLLATGFFLWAAHHLDYPLLRAKGAWNPWGYYIDIALMLVTGVGILMLVVDELGRGLSTLSVLSGDLQRGDFGASTNDLLARPLALSGVRGSALYIGDAHSGRFVAALGACDDWPRAGTDAAVSSALTAALTRGEPRVSRAAAANGASGGPQSYLAVLPLFSGSAVSGALVMTGDERDPFTALDDSFLLALGRQVGAALERSDLLRRLADRTRDLERLSVSVIHQHEAERRKISLELHDETAQLFAAVKLQLGVLQEASDPDARVRLERVLSLVDAGIHSIRRVSSELRPPLLDDLGFLPALRALVEEFSQRTGIAVNFRTPVTPLRLSDEAEVALFRTLQEALSNVARHASATRVDVLLSPEDATVRLEIRDDGRGFSAPVVDGLPANAHAGMTGMRERAIAVGGDLEARAGRSGGVEVEIRVPHDATVQV